MSARETRAKARRNYLHDHEGLDENGEDVLNEVLDDEVSSEGEISQEEQGGRRAVRRGRRRLGWPFGGGVD